METLSRLAREDVGHLVALLRAELQHDRMQPAFSLAWTLAHLDDPAALGVLMTAVRHRDAYVRWAACIGLRRLRAVEARALLNVAAADRSSLVRSEAVEALEQQGDTSSLPVLTKRLQDRYPGIQLAAKQAIGAIERRTTSKQGGLS
jgi:HEAT repeat protein